MAAQQLGKSSLIVLGNKLLQQLLVGTLIYSPVRDELAEPAENGLAGTLGHDPASSGRRSFSL
jgi:hypothetical protein